MNHTLSIGLSQSWTPANVSINAATKGNGVPILNSATLWPASDNGSFYSIGGALGISPFGSALDVPPGLWQFQETMGDWNEVESESPAAPILGGTQHAGGLGASGGGFGYVLGGYVGAAGKTDWPMPGLLSYDMTAKSRSNDSSAGVSLFGTIIYGGMRFVPNYGAEGILIVLGGVFTGPTDTPWNTTVLDIRSFSNVSLYDVATKSWYWQSAVGATGSNDIPSESSMFCTTGVRSGRGTYEIFIYGGLNRYLFRNNSEIETEAQFSVYILSIPGFVWFKANDTSAQPRVGHTCELIGNRQMVSIGGINPNISTGPTGPGGLNFADPWPQGLGIFDMVALRWTNSYDANAAPYTPANVIENWYNQP